MNTQLLTLESIQTLNIHDPFKNTSQYTGVTYFLYFKIDTPNGQVTSCLFPHQMRVIPQEVSAVETYTVRQFQHVVIFNKDYVVELVFKLIHRIISQQAEEVRHTHVSAYGLYREAFQRGWWQNYPVESFLCAKSIGTINPI